MADIEEAPEPLHSTLADRVSGGSMNSSQGDIEKLGRERPAVFKNALMEIGFCLSILASNLVSVSPRPPGPAYSSVAMLRMSHRHVTRPGR
jgi:hypothetical protein